MNYSVKDLQERYDVTQNTVLHWINTGQLRALNVGIEPGKKKPRWRITQEALEAFESIRLTAPLPKQPRRRQMADVIERY
jgi:hypothetical protein